MAGRLVDQSVHLLVGYLVEATAEQKVELWGEKKVARTVEQKVEY